MYERVRDEAEAIESSVAHFCREAAIARAALMAHERGFQWADNKAWEPIFDLIEDMDKSDSKRRAELARERRLGNQGRESSSA
jgi:hypothetical protein